MRHHPHSWSHTYRSGMVELVSVRYLLCFFCQLLEGASHTWDWDLPSSKDFSFTSNHAHVTSVWPRFYSHNFLQVSRALRRMRCALPSASRSSSPANEERGLEAGRERGLRRMWAQPVSNICFLGPAPGRPCAGASVLKRRGAYDKSCDLGQGYRGELPSSPSSAGA